MPVAAGEERDVVRISVRKYDEKHGQRETKRFSIDPSITNYTTLRELLSKAFHIDTDFVVSYLMPKSDSSEDDRYLPMLSDWDLNAAVYAASHPMLMLKVDLKSVDRKYDEWDIIDESDLLLLHPSHSTPQFNTQEPSRYTSALAMAAGLAVQASATVEGMLSGRNNSTSSNTGGKHTTPLDDCEWRSMLDSEGRLICHRQLRLQVYQRGVQPHLRPVVWRHLLNVYPHNMTGEERIAYTRALGETYCVQKQCWQGRLRSGRSTEELRLIANAVRKDVIRTDRLLPFYAGDENENSNLLSLFNILCTYALCHPDVTYCQGMSDLCSPLLYVLQDEAQTYIAFSALMRRLKSNFSCDGRSMTKKFQHLAELLQYYDPMFYEYLREMHAEDLLFAYRWLLLELKREFTFTDSLRVLEVMWASLPPDPPAGPLPLFQVDLTNCDDMPFSPSLLHLPSSRAARLMSFMCMNAVENLQPTDEDTGGVLTPDSQSDSSCESDDNAFFNPAPFTVNDIGNGNNIINKQLTRTPPQAVAGQPQQHHQRVHSMSSSHTLHQNTTVSSGSCSRAAPVAIPVPDCARNKPLVSTSDLPVAQSCPGNLNGLCHASVIRHLMLGSRQQQETGTHHHVLECVSSSSSRRDEVQHNSQQPPRRRLPSSSTHSTCSNPTYLSRHIKPSAEQHVSDSDDGGSTKQLPPPKKLSFKTHEAKVPSPVPLAAEATQLSAEDEEAEEEDLTLTDIYDICVGQVDDADSEAARSRQTSGDAARQHRHNNFQPETTSTPLAAGSKSRHASSTQTTSYTNYKDSGYSGTSTPLVRQSGGGNASNNNNVSPWKQPRDTQSNADSMLSNAGSATQPMPQPSQPLLENNDTSRPPQKPQPQQQPSNSSTNAQHQSSFVNVEHSYVLPGPAELGDGNPLLMFICLTLLLEHRQHIIKHNMDFNECAIYFDKLSRKHNAHKVLRRARRLYKDYLSAQALMGGGEDDQ